MEKMFEPLYSRESEDKAFAAWYGESWAYGRHYRFFSYSPWHNCGAGTRYDTEKDARQAVDHFMDVWMPAALELEAVRKKQGR